MNKYLANEITRIDRDYSDPVIYAQSYSEYLSNQTAVLQDVVNVVMDLVSSTEDDNLPVDYDYIVSSLNADPETDVVTDFVETGSNKAQVLPNIIGSSLETSTDHTKADQLIADLKPYWSSSLYSQSDSTIVPFSEFAKASFLSANGLIDDGVSAIANAKGKLSTLDTVLTDVKTQINEQMALSTALDLLCEEAKQGIQSSLSDFYSALNLKSANLSREGIVSSLKTYVLSDYGDVRSRTFSLIDSVSSSGEQSIEQMDPVTGYVPGTMDLSGYTGVSAATVSGTLNAGPFKKVCKTIGTALKGAVGATVAVLKAGFKTVKRLTKKYVAPIVSNPVFVQNSEFQVDSVDQPIFAGYISEGVFWPLSSQPGITFDPPYVVKAETYSATNFDSYLTVTDIVNTMSGGADFSNFVKTAFRMFGDTAPHYALHMRYMFFDLYFSLNAETSDSDKTGDIYIEVYPVPTSFNNLPSFHWTWTHTFSDRTKYTVSENGNDNSLASLVHALYPEDPTSIQISSEDISGTVATDLSMIKCCIASAYRTMAYAQLRLLVNMPGQTNVKLQLANGNVVDTALDTGDYVFLGNQSNALISERPKIAAIPFTMNMVNYSGSSLEDVPGTRYPLVFVSDNPYSGVPDSAKVDCENLPMFVAANNDSNTIPDFLISAGAAGPAKPANWAWFALHMSDVSGDVTNTSYWKFAAEGSVPICRGLGFSTAAHRSYAATSSASIFMIAMLFSIVSNKREYMQTVYLNSGGQEWPLFIPYERVAQRLSPRYHIKSDAEIKAKADAIITGAVIAVIALLATAAAAYFGFKIKGKVKTSLAKAANDAESKKYAYQNLLTAQREGDKTVYDTVVETVDGKKVSKVVPRIVSAPSQAEVDAAYKLYKKSQKKANRIGKFASKIGAKDWTGNYAADSSDDNTSGAQFEANQLITLIAGENV